MTGASRVGRLLWLTCWVVVLLELGLRLLWVKQPILKAGIEHPHFHHRLAPNSDQHFFSDEFDAVTRTNRYGLRGPDPVIPKPPGTIRLLMLGDSFTFGFPVRDEETFCALIEAGLREHGYPVEVINGGVSGYAPTLHYVSLRDQFLAFEPDVVLLWYDLGDLQEDHWFQKNLVYDTQGRIVRCDPRSINGRFSWWEFIKAHSALARYVEKKPLATLNKIRILGFWEYVAVKRRGERAKVAIARLKAAQQADDLAASDRFLLVRDTSTPELVAPYWQMSRRYLLMIRELLEERHIPFILGTYPYGMLVGPDQWGRGRTFWGFEPGRTYDGVTAWTILTQFTQEAAIPFLNTVDSFRKAARTETLFYDWDGHMTPAGHRVLADHVIRDPALLHVLRLARRPHS